MIRGPAPRRCWCRARWTLPTATLRGDVAAAIHGVGLERRHRRSDDLPIIRQPSTHTIFVLGRPITARRIQRGGQEEWPHSASTSASSAAFRYPVTGELQISVPPGCVGHFAIAR